MVEVTLGISQATLNILYTIVTAIVYGLYSYDKSTPQEQFQWLYFLKTVVIGALVGYVQVTFMLSYDQAYAYVIANPLITIVIDKLFNWIAGRLGAFAIIRVVPISDGTLKGAR